MFFLNKHPAGKPWNALFGLAEVCDGLIRVLTFGFVATTLTLLVSRKQAECMIKKLKANRNKNA